MRPVAGALIRALGGSTARDVTLHDITRQESLRVPLGRADHRAARAPPRDQLGSAAVDAMKLLGARRRARQQLAILRARQALTALPDIDWHDTHSEQHARQKLHDAAAVIDRALKEVRTSSAEGRALKYAQAWMTAWLQGWGDPNLIPSTHAAPMYQRLVDAMHAVSLRLAPDGHSDPPDPDEPPSQIAGTHR